MLASLGQQAIDTYSLLNAVTEDYAEWPIADLPAADPSASTPLLQRLQKDIREPRPPVSWIASNAHFDPRPELSAHDHSLSIHCCHCPRRELKVFREELLRAFADLPDLQPEEVLIAVTDFDLYAPLAEAVLRSGPHPLPVRLTAIPAREPIPSPWPRSDCPEVGNIELSHFALAENPRPAVTAVAP